MKKSRLSVLWTQYWMRTRTQKTRDHQIEAEGQGHWTHFWKPVLPGPCWVCGEETEWAYLDMAHQHPDCDSWPSPDGDVTIIGGRKQVDSDG